MDFTAEPGDRLGEDGGDSRSHQSCLQKKAVIELEIKVKFLKQVTKDFMQ